MPTKSCPICAKRRGKRHCPGLARSRWAGKTETICAQCCGKQREAAIDCPLDCPYLLAAHRYEAERPTAAPAELAFPQVALDRDFLDEQQRFIAALALFFCRFAAEQKDVRDADLLAALDSLARGYQTLESGLYYEQPPAAAAAPPAALAPLARGSQTRESGLYYEQPPDAVAARALYAAARDFLEQYSQIGRASCRERG